MRRNETAHRRNRGRWCRGGRRVLERGSAGRPSADSQHLSELRQPFRRSGPKSCRNLRSLCRRRTSQPKSIAWPQITRACALAIPAHALLSPKPPRDPTRPARNRHCLDEPGGCFWVAARHDGAGWPREGWAHSLAALGVPRGLCRNRDTFCVILPVASLGPLFKALPSAVPSWSFCGAHWPRHSPLAPGRHVRGPASHLKSKSKSKSSGKFRNPDKMKVCGAQTPSFLGPATHRRGGKMRCWSRGGRGFLEKRPAGPPSAASQNLSEFPESF